ncbi:MAG: dephospho-CoA kinase [Chloroflexota bacterium]|nr:dephospho-CoA kinase [Chloroflexota bacterium]
MRGPVIGLTGNIACGKSTVLRMVRDLGALAIDADELTHQALAPDGTAYRAVVEAFGPSIVGEGGEIDRRALGRKVFSDAAELRRLEELVHPHVRAEVERLLAARSEPAVVDAIKLLEGGLARLCDEVWVVCCRPEQQVARLMERNGFSREEALLRIRAQPPQEEKLRVADVVINNENDLKETRRQVAAAWGRARSQKGREV